MCSVCHGKIATHVGPWGPGKCTIHGAVHTATYQATSPHTSSQVSTTLPSSFHSDAVQVSYLNLHHSDGSGHFSPPTGVQVSTLDLHPSQHNPMPGTVISTINSYVLATASGSINNTDNHGFQATLDLILNNMASMQTQLNHVIDTQNVSNITGDQHGKQSKSSQPDMITPVLGVYSFCDHHSIQHNMVQAEEQAPQGMMHISCLYNMSGSLRMSNNVMIQLAGPVIDYQTMVALYLASRAQ